MEPGTSLNNIIWDILLRTRLNHLITYGDIRQAFQDRDVLRFHWFFETNPNHLQILKTTRADFGISQTPIFLNEIVKVHLQISPSFHQSQEEQIRDLAENIYVDDIITVGAVPQEAIQLKDIAMATLRDVGFKLGKWKFNISELQNDPWCHQLMQNKHTQNVILEMIFMTQKILELSGARKEMKLN